MVLPVGGSCQIPFVMKKLKKIFKGSPINEDGNFKGLLSVAYGAAIQAHNRETGLDKIDLYDTIPYPIGFEYGERKMDPFVTSGQYLPIKETKRYTPKQDNQTSAEYKIYRGDSEWVERNQFVDQLTISDIPPNTKKNDFPMTVEINVNRSGVIDVKVWKEGKEDNELGSLQVVMDLSKLEGLVAEMKEHFDLFEE